MCGEHIKTAWRDRQGLHREDDICVGRGKMIRNVSSYRGETGEYFFSRGNGRNKAERKEQPDSLV